MPAIRTTVRIAALALVAVATACTSSTQPPKRPNDTVRVRDDTTYMYEGGKRTGSVDRGEFADPLVLNVDCSGGSGYTGGSVAINARRTWIYVNDMADHHWGFARLQKPGRWAIYFVGKGRSLEGFAKQQTAGRWDIHNQRSRRVGYTLGPDGPQAAAVALTMC